MEGEISFVIPLFNEEESLKSFYEELNEEVKKLKYKYEIVFVDDGSTDNSLSIIKELSRRDKHVRVFSLRRNMGKSDALYVGFHKARGEVIVTLDADLQDKPSEIKKLLAKYEQGVEVVCGWRKDRQDKQKMIVISKFFNYITNRLFHLTIHDYNCGLKLYTRGAALGLPLYGGLYRFIPLMVAEQGFVIDEVEVEHDVRRFGKSKYGFSKLWKNLPDLFTVLFLTKFRKRPLHFFGVVGILFVTVGSILLFYFWVDHTFFKASVGGRPLLYIAVVAVISGLQIFFTGFLAELMLDLAHNKSDSGRVLDVPLKYSSDKSDNI